MAGLSWLHLSDWHQKGREFERFKVRDALMMDIRERANINHHLEKIDFVVFSGDVAYHGVTEEYQAAVDQLFTPLLKAAGVGLDRLFIVPGNHDLEWAALSMLPADLLQKLDSPHKVNEWLTEKRRRRALLEPMAAYSQFVTSYLGGNASPEPAYGYTRSIEAGGKRIAIISLNSAWLCARNKDDKGKVNDRGYLIIGECQVYDALAQAEDAEMLIAILHHPFDWMIEFDQHRVEESLRRQCHFILHGHQHRPLVEVVRSTTGECVTIPAGACYNREVASDLFYTNAYNFVHLDFDTGWGTVYLRRWSPRRGEWVVDVDSCDEGQFHFALPKELDKATPLITPWIELDEPNVIPTLREWKTVHTVMQSLFDRLAPVIYLLDLCLISSQLEEHFFQLEMLWQQCVSLMRVTLEEFRFEHIHDETVVVAVLDRISQVDSISKQIADANSPADVQAVRQAISEIRERVATALTIADRRIVDLVDTLGSKL